MKEELNTKMHSEFKVSDANAIKHRCFSAFMSLELGYTIAEVLELYDVTEEQLNKHKETYDLLSSK